MAEISKITLPSGTTYDIKDATARTQIETIQGTITGAMAYIGTTTTEITDGSTTNPITISGSDYTAAAGNVVIYGDTEFVWSDTDSKWHEFGSTGSLKALAFKDSASGTVKAAGTVSQPTFTGTASTATATYTPTGTISISEGDGTGNYTPSGTISAITATKSNVSINSMTSAGTLPSCTLPTFSATVSSETLILGWSAGTFSAGSLPASEAKSAISDVSLSTPTFTGTAVDLEATFTGDSASITSSYTPSGTVSKPSFTGSDVTVTVS